MRQNIKTFFRIFSLAFLLPFLASAQEESEVPPPLPGVPNPGFEIDRAPDRAFARYLSDLGNTEGAVIAWRQVMHETNDSTLQREALLSIISLYQKRNDCGNLERVWSEFGNRFPNDPEVVTGLFTLWQCHRHTPGEAQELLARLQQAFPHHTLTNKALYATYWQARFTGRENVEIPPLNEARELETRLQAYPAIPANLNAVTWAALIPGLGHWLQGDPRTGLSAFAINMIFIVALFYASYRGPWGAVPLLLLFTGILYGGNVFSSHSLALRTAHEARQAAMLEWRDLHPESISDFEEMVVSSTAQATHPLAAPLWFFRNVVGKFDGQRSNSYPPSSSYAWQAYEKFGPVTGTMVAVDRLLRDWREAANPALQVVAEVRSRYVDQLISNTFWLDPANG